MSFSIHCLESAIKSVYRANIESDTKTFRHTLGSVLEVLETVTKSLKEDEKEADNGTPTNR